MEEVDLDAALRQRRRPMWRLLGVVIVGFLLLVTIIGTIATVNPGMPAALGELLHGTPPPTATIGLGGDIAYYENGAPWGKLTVDGRTVPIDAAPKPDFLDRGKHTLIYRADPFPALRCTISTPAAALDTCPLDATFARRFGQPLYKDTRAVDLGSTIARLPIAQQDALIALVRGKAEYTSPATAVLPGEHYGSIDKGHITLETAMQPLNATLQIRLQNSNSGDPYFDCVSVCVRPLNSTPISDQTDFPKQLEVWAHVKAGYHYTTENGAVVLDYAPPFQTQQAAEWRPDSVIALYASWNGAWQVTRHSQDSATLPCQSGAGDLYPGSRAIGYETDTLTGIRPAPNPTDGCLLVVRRKSGETVYGPPILFLERFGVLLAVGDAAHQLRPNLLVTSQRETDEANTIAALAPLP